MPDDGRESDTDCICTHKVLKVGSHQDWLPPPVLNFMEAILNDNIMKNAGVTNNMVQFE